MRLSILRTWLALCLSIPVNSGFSQSAGELQTWLWSHDSVKFSVLVQNTAGDVLFAHRQQQSVVPASIIKISILQVFFSRYGNEDGQLAGGEYVLESADIVGGAGSMQFESPGQTYTFKQLAERMIAQSDNTATNIIIQKCSMEQINTWLSREGYQQTRLLRKMMDLDAIRNGIQNTTSAEEINAQLLRIYNDARRGSRSACAMLSMLQNCDDSAVMPSGLPPGTIVAHKSGLLEGMRGDAGIIFLNKPLIISIFVEGCRSQQSSEAIIAELTKRIVQLYSK